MNVCPCWARILCCLVLLTSFSSLWGNDSERLAQELAPWIELTSGELEQFSLTGKAAPVIDGNEQPVTFQLIKYDAESFDLILEHEKYAATVRRRVDGIALAVPKHQVVFLGTGEIDPVDHLQPAGIVDRLIKSGTAIHLPVQLVKDASAEDVAGALMLLAKVTYSSDEQRWKFGDKASFAFSNDNRTLNANVNGAPLELTISEQVAAPPGIKDWPGLTIKNIPRAELERQLTRGTRRALEVLTPSNSLTNPQARERKVEHGELCWVEGQRVVLLQGTPEQIGKAHGELLLQESHRCIDSVLYAFGTVQTVVNGRWFREDLQQAHARLAPHIPERHKVETRALAASLKLDAELVETVNVFPELFHCSGFAVFGAATKDGKLYHGRVLDYMTTIGLQDCATTFIIAPDGKIPFANVGYAGFIGSVSGMNAEQISLGEMGGRGEGQWDGVPMATLMRRALEECDSLAKVKTLWEQSPRTCEYYYVFADGEEKTAVGVAATPEKIQFVLPGEGHELLGEGIQDSVVLSAGSRLQELRKRVTEGHGKIDVLAAQNLMCRPVAMTSNLHNVLFVPEDGVFYVANADHKSPAAERPYVKIDLREYLRRMDVGEERAQLELQAEQSFTAVDTLSVGNEESTAACKCLDELSWPNAQFQVTLKPAWKNNGDWMVRFPSARPVKNELNDTVAMEWFQAKNAAGEPIVAPAVVVIHESGSGMTAGRLIAQMLQAKGLHAFMIHLPFYGVRRGEQRRPQGEQLVDTLKQGVADARRARDAVAALPLVDASRISLQGTSLGGFLAATTAGLDNGYHRVFILLAGGDVYSVLMEGKRDAAKVREELMKTGLTEAEVKEIIDTIEPLRLAHRVNADRTWLFSGTHDEVVPLRNAELFAKAAKLEEAHHVKMLANHYSGVIFLPMVVQQMRDAIYASADK